jgi:3-oxoacyl-[acyl-carrier protein] reductase
MIPRLENKRALVTGGGRGIGAAIARRLASEGAHVALTYFGNRDPAHRTVKAIQGLGVKALAIRADSADARPVVASVDQTVREFGGIDDYRLEEFDRMLAVNVRAVFVATQAAGKHMKAGARIVNLRSCNAERMPFTGGSVYARSKAGLVRLVKGLARDLGPRGITINNIQPGSVDTDLNPATSDFARMTVERFTALPRNGTGEETASLVAGLVSPEASYVTGASLSIDGGYAA